MKDSEARQMDRGQRVHEFVVVHNASFPAGSRAAELIAAHSSVITAAEQQAGKQAAANLDWQEATEQKNAAINSLLAEMRVINRVARSIDKQFPGIGDQFRMPRNSDQNVINHARGFIESATPIATEFTNRGLPASFLTDLQAAIDAVEAAESHQSIALANKTASTANLDAALKQERDIVRELNAIVRSVFRNDPGTLAAWESASSIESAPKKKKATPPPPPPPPVK
jgi:hypothetical protein